MAYNADNHRSLTTAQARGIGMVTVRNTGLCTDAESRLRRMMRAPKSSTAKTSYRGRQRVSERVMRHSGLAHAIPMVDAATALARKAESMAMLSDEQIARLVRTA